MYPGFTDVAGESVDAVGSKRAHLYDLAGFVRDLPDMGVGRTSHGCGSYIRDDGSQVRCQPFFSTKELSNMKVVSRSLWKVWRCVVCSV